MARTHEGGQDEVAIEPEGSIQQRVLRELAALGDLRGKRVLDVGAGGGWLSAQLAAAGARVTVLDLEARPADPRIRAVVHNLDDPVLPFADQEFDAVVSTEVLEHLRAPFLVLRDLVRVLKKGGRLVLTIPNYWNVKYRLRYLLTGNFQRVAIDDRKRRAYYLRGYAPHINAIPYPILKSVLSWEGCEHFVLGHSRLMGWQQRLFFAPWLAAIRLFTWCGGARRRARQLLDETNSDSALLGARQVLIACTKTGRG